MYDITLRIGGRNGTSAQKRLLPRKTRSGEPDQSLLNSVFNYSRDTFFEFVKNIADFSTEGDNVRLPPVLFQPMAADDVASAIGGIAMSSPVNATLEIAGPELFRLDELIRPDLAARKDPREAISDLDARYYGIAVSERTLVPTDDARLGEMRFEDWLSHAAKRVPYLQPA